MTFSGGTSSARRWLSFAQSTILRLQTPSTAVRYRDAAAIGTEVMSAPSRLKPFRAVATRYDQTARNFLTAVYLAALPFGSIDDTS